MPTTFTTPSTLLSYLGLNPDHCPFPLEHRPRYPFRVSTCFARAIRREDWYDPLLLQVLPQKKEVSTKGMIDPDPVNDCAAMKAPGLLQKYRGRVLLYLPGECAINCRFCFRKEFARLALPHPPTIDESTFQRIDADRSLSEVVLSGGDPLMLRPQHFGSVLRRLAKIDHVRRVRIHTRVPVADPDRFGSLQFSVLTRLISSKQVVVAVHVNHPAELHPHCRGLLTRLHESGILLLSQSVLLAGINDRIEILEALYQDLAECRVIPGYLHQLDPAPGTAHFKVPITKGRQLIRALRNSLPGYLVPRYLQEIAGRESKTVLA